MGASASMIELTPADVGEYVYNLGEAYQKYKPVIVANGVDGNMLASTDTASLKDILEGLEITNKLHVMKLTAELSRIGSAAAVASNSVVTSSSAPSAAPGTVSTGSADYDKVVFREKLVTAPSTLMSQLFKIQGTPCDPTDLAPTVAALARSIKQCIAESEAAGVPRKEFDCFLSYRIAADLLYFKLRDIDVGKMPVLDQHCLKMGEDWKVGFQRGLNSSSVCVALARVKGGPHLRCVVGVPDGSGDQRRAHAGREARVHRPRAGGERRGRWENQEVQ